MISSFVFLPPLLASVPGEVGLLLTFRLENPFSKSLSPPLPPLKSAKADVLLPLALAVAVALLFPPLPNTPSRSSKLLLC